MTIVGAEEARAGSGAEAVEAWDGWELGLSARAAKPGHSANMATAKPCRKSTSLRRR